MKLCCFIMVHICSKAPVSFNFSFACNNTLAKLHNCIYVLAILRLCKGYITSISVSWLVWETLASFNQKQQWGCSLRREHAGPPSPSKDWCRHFLPLFSFYKRQLMNGNITEVLDALIGDSNMLPYLIRNVKTYALKVNKGRTCVTWTKGTNL